MMNITAPKIRKVSKNAYSRSEILIKLGVTHPTGKYYARLESITEANGIVLPPPRKTNPKTGISPKKRTSAVWNEELLRKAVQDSFSLGEILRKLNMPTKDARGLKAAAHKFEIMLPSGLKLDEAGRRAKLEKLVSKYLVLGNKGDLRYDGQRIRQIVVGLNLIEDICDECKTGPFWNNKPLTLQIDHKNGNAIDNRIENIRILCANCHTQTITFGGKNKGNGMARN